MYSAITRDVNSDKQPTEIVHGPNSKHDMESHEPR